MGWNGRRSHALGSGSMWGQQQGGGPVSASLTQGGSRCSLQQHVLNVTETHSCCMHSPCLSRTRLFTLPPTAACALSLEHVLKTRMPNYNKGATFRHNLGPLLGHGIFTSDGSAWHWQRKLAANVFSVKRCAHCCVRLRPVTAQ